MNAHWFLLVLLTILFWNGCKEEENPQPRVSSLTIVASPEQPSYAVGVDITFSVALDSDPAVGIRGFAIRKGTETVFEKNDYTTNQVKFNYGYTTIREDIALGTLPFTFELTDGNGVRKTAMVEIRVEVDYPFQVDNFSPQPGWDLVKNEVVPDSTGPNVDIYQYTLSLGFSTETYWTNSNGTLYYDISDKSVNFFDPNLSLETIRGWIEGVDGVDTLLVSTGGFSSGGFTTPIVAQLRGKEEYILIDFSNIQGSNLGYRKTAELAGE